MTQAEMVKTLHMALTVSQAIVCGALPQPQCDATVFEIAMWDYVTGAARITASEKLYEFYGV